MMTRHFVHQSAVTAALVLLVLSFTARAQDCRSFHEKLQIPCRCSLQQGAGIVVNCDNVVFPGSFPLLPLRLEVVSYQQRNAGIQDLTSQLFTASDLPLSRLDFSRNTIRVLREGVFDGLEDRLQELSLHHNLLGDTYDPTFKSTEIAKLTALTALDLGHNGIRELDRSTLMSLKELQVLKLEGNHLRVVPSDALEQMQSLRVLTLQENNLDTLMPGAFTPVSGLVFLNLSYNHIPEIAAGAFANLNELTTLDLSHNRLSSLEEGTLEGLSQLEELDLSSNFLTQVPDMAIRDLRSLRTLVLKDNLIQNLGGIVALGPMASLRRLDLSRSFLGEITPGTFRQLRGLTSLKLSVILIRRIDNNVFDGLQSLKELHLDSDEILSIPSLEKVPLLQVLTMDYNRVGVISASNFQSVQELRKLSIAYNLIREVSEGTFSNLTKLEELNLYGNLITTLQPDSLLGPRNSLSLLNLGLNKLTEIPLMDFPKVSTLILSKNNISTISPDTFLRLPNLKTLDLSENFIGELPVNLFYPLSQLTGLDLSKNMLTQVQPGQFNESIINFINLSSNKITAVRSSGFESLLLLHTIDLSKNQISVIEDGAFFNTPFLHILRLNENNLNTFREQLFDLDIGTDETELRILDLSKNDIAFLPRPTTGKLSKLTWLNLANNRIGMFPSDMVKGVPDLQHLNLEANRIDGLKDYDFSNSPRLRELNLAHNEIHEVSEKAMQNSTQLQRLDLSHNDITRLPSDVFLGLSRLWLDLSHNNIREFPERIFHRTKIQEVQSLNLAHNNFPAVPTKALGPQYSFLSDLNMAHNKIKNVPRNADILVNIMGLDLSYNPLTKDDIDSVLNEPKKLRYLNLAGTNISDLPSIEMRFLLYLNLSNNNIENVRDDSFGTARNLRTLDFSRNKLRTLSYGLASIWPKLPYLRYLDISGNPFSYIVRGDLSYLPQLRVLKATDLRMLAKIEESSLKSLKTLKELHVHTLPALKSINSKNMLETLPGLEVVDVEITDSEIHDQLHPAFTSRLRELTIRGKNVQALSGGAFAGIKSPMLEIGLINTSISSLSSQVFIPVPMSSQITLDVDNSQLASIDSTFVSSLNPRSRHLELKGLGSNPLYCDCNARPMRSWLLTLEPSNSLYNVSCAGPKQHIGRLIRNVQDSQLTCEGIPTTTTTDPPSFTSTRRSVTTDNIITKDDVKVPKTNKSSKKAGVLNDMDILIIGIVGGVIAFVALAILFGCLIKYLCDSSKRKQKEMAGVPCTCLKPPLPPPSWGYPHYPTMPHMSSRNSTIKMMHSPSTPVSMGPQHYGTLGGRSTRSYRSSGTVPYYLQNCPPDYDQD